VRGRIVFSPDAGCRNYQRGLERASSVRKNAPTGTHHPVQCVLRTAIRIIAKLAPHVLKPPSTHADSRKKSLRNQAQHDALFPRDSAGKIQSRLELVRSPRSVAHGEDRRRNGSPTTRPVKGMIPTDGLGIEKRVALWMTQEMEGTGFEHPAAKYTDAIETFPTTALGLPSDFAGNSHASRCIRHPGQAPCDPQDRA